MSDVAYVEFDCVRCEETGQFKIDVDNIRSSSDPYGDVQNLIENVDPQLAASLGNLVLMYVVAMMEIADRIDDGDNSEHEGRCSNCDRRYTQDDLRPEDDPAFQFSRP